MPGAKIFVKDKSVARRSVCPGDIIVFHRIHPLETAVHEQAFLPVFFRDKHIGCRDIVDVRIFLRKHPLAITAQQTLVPFGVFNAADVMLEHIIVRINIVNLRSDDIFSVSVDESHLAVRFHYSCQALRKDPCVFVFALDSNFACIYIEEASLSVLITKYSKRILVRNTCHPFEIRGDIFPCLTVIYTHIHVTENMNADVLTEITVPIMSILTIVVIYLLTYSASNNQCCKQSYYHQRHLPADVEYFSGYAPETFTIDFLFHILN